MIEICVASTVAPADIILVRVQRLRHHAGHRNNSLHILVNSISIQVIMQVAEKIVIRSERNGFCFEFKVMLFFINNVGEVDSHERVAVSPFLFMIKTESVLKFFRNKQNRE